MDILGIAAIPVITVIAASKCNCHIGIILYGEPARWLIINGQFL